MNPEQLLAELTTFQLALPARGLFEHEETVATRVATVERLDVAGVCVPRITNEFWTARQRQGHSLHELSYRACFKAELPRFFVSRLTRQGDACLDPFMGRGTTLLEAGLLGRRPLGNDANPLARVLIEPRLDPPELGEVAARLHAIFDGLRDPGPESDEPELGVFYAPSTLAALRALRRWFLDRAAEGGLDRVDRWLRMVATNRLTGHSSGFFSGRTMPPNQAVSVKTQRKINERLGVVPPPRDVAGILLKKSRTLLRDVTPQDLRRLRAVAPRSIVTIGDARTLEGIADASVACTVTSPPFLNVVDYALDNWLRCWFNGLDAEAIASHLTTPSRLEDWCAFLRPVFAALHRVTRAGGWVVFEVGEVRGGSLKLEESVLPIARDAGLDAIAVAVHAQDFTKTANCWGVTNNRKGTNTNRLVVLRKPDNSRK